MNKGRLMKTFSLRQEAEKAKGLDGWKKNVFLQEMITS